MWGGTERKKDKWSRIGKKGPFCKVHKFEEDRWGGASGGGFPGKGRASRFPRKNALSYLEVLRGKREISF